MQKVYSSGEAHSTPLVLSDKPKLPLLLHMTTPDGGELKILQRIGDGYYKLGLQLLNDEDGSRTRAIMDSHPCKPYNITIAIVSTWLTEGSGIQPITWATFVFVLKQVGLVKLAQDVEKLAYEPPPENEPAASASMSETPATIPLDLSRPSNPLAVTDTQLCETAQCCMMLLRSADEVQKEIEVLKKQFGSLRDKVRVCLERQRVVVNKVAQTLTTLSPDDDEYHQIFLQNHVKNLDTASSISELFLTMNLHWNYLDPSLLDHLVRELELSDAKKQSETYNSQLCTFRKKTPLTLFVKTQRKKRKKIPPDFEEVIVCFPNSASTLEEMEEFRQEYASHYSLHEFAMMLNQVRSGSIIITWIIHKSLTRIILNGNMPVHIFKKYNVTKVTVGEVTVYIEGRHHHKQAHELSLPLKTEQWVKSTRQRHASESQPLTQLFSSSRISNSAQVLPHTSSETDPDQSPPQPPQLPLGDKKIDKILLDVVSCLVHQENCRIPRCPCREVKKRFQHLMPQMKDHMSKEADKVVEDVQSGKFDQMDRRQQMRLSISSQNFSPDIHAHYHMTSRSHIRQSDDSRNRRMRALQRRRSRSMDLTPVMEQPGESSATTPSVMNPDHTRGLLCGPAFSPAISPAGEKFKVLSPTTPSATQIAPPYLLKEISLSSDNLPALCLNDCPMAATPLMALGNRPLGSSSPLQSNQNKDSPSSDEGHVSNRYTSQESSSSVRISSTNSPSKTEANPSVLEHTFVSQKSKSSTASSGQESILQCRQNFITNEKQRELDFEVNGQKRVEYQKEESDYQAYSDPVNSLSSSHEPHTYMRQPSQQSASSCYSDTPGSYGKMQSLNTQHRKSTTSSLDSGYRSNMSIENNPIFKEVFQYLEHPEGCPLQNCNCSTYKTKFKELLVQIEAEEKIVQGSAEINEGAYSAVKERQEMPPDISSAETPVPADTDISTLCSTPRPTYLPLLPQKKYKKHPKIETLESVVHIEAIEASHHQQSHKRSTHSNTQYQTHVTQKPDGKETRETHV